MQSWLEKEQVLLSQQVKAGKLPHALLISGIEGSGKHNLAQWLIQVLHCNLADYDTENPKILQPCNQCKNCHLLLKNTYPDHQVADSDKNLLGVDIIRAVSVFFEKTAQIGLFKSVLVPNANKMTEAAANALLKTLEEPTDKSIIILLANERDTLLPTIISRCRLFEIRPPSGLLLSEQLFDKAHQNNDFINLSHLPELTNEEQAKAYKIFEQTLLHFLTEGANRTELTQMVCNSLHGIRWLEKIITNLIRQEYNWDRVNTKGSLTAFSHDTLWHIYRSIIFSSSQIKRLSQANNEFIVEKLIIDIDNIMTNSKLQEL